MWFSQIIKPNGLYALLPYTVTCVGFALGIVNPSYQLFYCSEKSKVFKTKQYLKNLVRIWIHTRYLKDNKIVKYIFISALLDRPFNSKIQVTANKYLSSVIWTMMDYCHTSKKMKKPGTKRRNNLILACFLLIWIS